MTDVGHLEILTVSNSAEFKSFLLIMCIDAPDFTTNSLSSGLVLDGEGRHHFPQARRMQLCVSPITSGFSLPAFTLLREPSALATLFLRPILKFWSVGATMIRIPTENFVERRQTHAGDHRLRVPIISLVLDAVVLPLQRPVEDSHLVVV